MTIETIARLRELRAKATAGEWWASPRVGYGIDLILSGDVLVGEFSPDDAAAIVAAMNSLDALLECASVLADIAAQKTGAELDEDQYEHADFEGGYGIVIDKARAALQALAEGGGG
jgi:hypothetical protein